jgi:hypothetical protein
MIRLHEEVMNNLTVEWVSFHYNWKEDFVFEYFTEYFYHRNECLASIQNSAHTLTNILTYVYHHEQSMPYDVVVIMNRYVYHYVNELIASDPIVEDRIAELYRRHRVSYILPLMIHRRLLMDVYPTVRSYLQEGY